MSLQKIKCLNCNGEQLIETSNSQIICFYCSSIISTNEAINNFKNNNDMAKTSEQIKRDLNNAQNYITIFNVKLNIIDYKFGIASLIIEMQNNNPIPLSGFKITFHIIDEFGNDSIGSVNSAINWNLDELELKKDKPKYIESNSMNFPNKNLLHKNLYVFIDTMTLVFKNNSIITLNLRIVNYLREDIDISMVKKYIEKIRSEKSNKIEEKNYLIYVFLGFILGAYGVHNFYAGNKKRAIIQLLLTLTFVGSVVSIAWAVIEAINALSNKEVPDYAINPKIF